MFDGEKKFKIEKPIRLITLFSGYDSQALSLKYLGVPFEHYRTSEWAIKSIQALKDLHFCEDNTDYSVDLTEKEIKDWLVGRISSNYAEPLTEIQINRLSEKEVRKIYNNMKATHNLGSIMNIKGEDLNIVDTDKFTYLLTYLLVSMPRFIFCRQRRRNGERQRNSQRIALGSRKAFNRNKRIASLFGYGKCTRSCREKEYATVCKMACFFRRAWLQDKMGNIKHKGFWYSAKSSKVFCCIGTWRLLLRYAQRVYS